MAAISLEAITKDYGPVRAIHGIDLDIPEGEFVAFVGPSGCGKSTLLRMIAGLEEISGGTLRIGGRVVNEVEPRGRDVAMVFQDYALYPHMSVADNIGFGLRMRGMPKPEIARRVAEVAEVLQIGPLLGRKPGQLSGGQRQRVAMGRAIVRRPQVFLFDEPLSNLDAKLRVDMRTQIKRLHAMLQTTTVYVTHDQVEAMTLADRVVLLRNGHVEQQGAPIEMYSRPQNRFVGEFIGSPTMNMLEAQVEHGPAGAQLKLGGQRIASPIHGLAGLDTVLVGIRPEHLGPGLKAGGAASGLSAVVDVVEPLGSDTLAICLVDGREVTARLPGEATVSKGETLTFEIDPQALHLFDARSGERIRAG